MGWAGVAVVDDIVCVRCAGVVVSVCVRVRLCGDAAVSK